MLVRLLVPGDQHEWGPTCDHRRGRGRTARDCLQQRLRISPTVYATDASPDEGGACRSTTSLSARGRAKCRLLCSFDDLGGGNAAIVLIEAFAGIGGLRMGCELLGVILQG